MGDKSGIEWTDATWNPTSGCTKVSQGCKNCYAERVFPRAYAKSGRSFTDLALHLERLDQPIRWQRPRRIFVDSMSDLFHEAVPFAFIDRVMATMIIASQHTYQILTKRPQRMLSYFTEAGVHERWNSALRVNPRTPPSLGGVTGEWFRTFAKHIWLGVSVEDQAAAAERIPVLLGIDAPMRFLSCEPLIGRVDMQLTWEAYPGKPLDWIIVGGESGPRARPMNPDWCREIHEYCLSSGSAFFMKQGSAANWADFKNFDTFPEDLRVREYP